MIDQHLVVVVLLIEAAIVAAAAALIVVHGLVLGGLRARRERAVTQAHSMLAESLETPGIDPDVVRTLRSLPAAMRVNVLADTGRNLSGASNARLGGIAGMAGALSNAARLTRSRRWRSRLRGARLFTALGGGSEHVPALLDDPRPEVLAQAVEWSPDHATPGIVERLVDLLLEGDALARYAVRDALQRLGPAAAPAVERRLDAASGTEAAALLGVATPIATAGMLPAARRLAADPDSATRAGAATLLAALGGAPARERLEVMLGDEDAGVRSTASRGLGRIGAWESGKPLAECLSDPAWEVRQGAALALRAIGAPGILFLRQALKSEDAFARDIARQVLDLPGSVEAFLP